VFIGDEINGAPCLAGETSVFFTLFHGKNESTLITLKDLKITRYRGGITIACATPKCTPPSESPPTVSSGNIIDGVIFDQIGDAYWASSVDAAGKAAILLNHTRGTRIVNSTFSRIDNIPSREGLIHAIYMTSVVQNTIVIDNTFIGGTGAIIKITDFSNNNLIQNNSFADNIFGIRDRFSGSFLGEEPIHCASWGTIISGNTFTNVTTPAVAYGYASGTSSCRFTEPPSNIRMYCNGVPKYGLITQHCDNL
jgi:hypothetical protein